MNALDFSADFANYKTVICVGSGGVGKTSVSAALAIRAAKAGKRVLVMTIDPSRRLKTSLGLDDNHGEVIEVALDNAKGKLFALLLDAEKIFTEFVVGSATEPEQSRRLLRNRLYQQLSTTLSGSQEFTSLLQLSKMAESEDFDLVVLDTPPAQHAVEFLEAPRKLQTLFQESIVKWFVGKNEVGVFRRLIAKGTQVVLSALERITGSQFMIELSDFFQSVQSLQQRINYKTGQVQDLLKSPQTAFILVTSFDEVKLQEGRSLKAYLKKRDYSLVLSIINRAFPSWYEMHLQAGNSSVAELPQSVLDWLDFYNQKTQMYDRILQSESDLKTIVIPDFSIDMSGLEAVGVLANEIHQRLT